MSKTCEQLKYPLRCDNVSDAEVNACWHEHAVTLKCQVQCHSLVALGVFGEAKVISCAGSSGHYCLAGQAHHHMVLLCLGAWKPASVHKVCPRLPPDLGASLFFQNLVVLLALAAL